MKKGTASLVLKTRRYPGCDFGSAWLVRKDGKKGMAGLLFGEVRLPTLEWLEQQAERHGVAVEKEQSPLTPSSPVAPLKEKTPPCPEERTLFDSLEQVP